MKDLIILILLLCGLLALGGCFPAAYDTSGISHWMAEQNRKDGVPEDENWADTKHDGTPQTIGLHFRAKDLKPHLLFRIDLGIVRTSLWWPLFHSTSIGIIGYPGLQFYHSLCPLGAKFDPTENDYLWCSMSFRIHKLSPVEQNNQAGS